MARTKCPISSLVQFQDQYLVRIFPRLIFQKLLSEFDLLVLIPFLWHLNLFTYLLESDIRSHPSAASLLLLRSSDSAGPAEQRSPVYQKDCDHPASRPHYWLRLRVSRTL